MKSTNKWLIPLILVAGFVFILSLRQLSDPDLGFHLKYGQWIAQHHQVPTHDLSTYSVTDNRYIDLQWLFQALIFQCYRWGGYPAISVLVCILVCTVFLLLLIMNRKEGIPLFCTIFWFLIAFLLIDPRIAPRPELFTFIFILVTMLILDDYTIRNKDRLFLLPITMLFWCNIHALFILGIFIILVYAAGKWVENKKIDRRLGLWALVSMAVCFLNPYELNGLLFPWELLTRFDPDNLFNQHIQEFIPFFTTREFLFRDYLFLLLLVGTFLLVIVNFSATRVHELILLSCTAILAITSIRNIPLFVLVSFPLVNRLSATTLQRFRYRSKFISGSVFLILIMIPSLLIPRLITNAFYLESKSFNKTGLGINPSHQPYDATKFLLDHHLDGKVMNSLGFGGWLSWVLPQPVFIDGRLEVMKESLYQDITKSWDGGLPHLIARYEPDLIIYNYLKYYPWTLQLKEMKSWRLVYVDGFSAIFARQNYRSDIPELNVFTLPEISSLTKNGTAGSWIRGFYCQPDFLTVDSLHMALFRAQMISGNYREQNKQQARIQFNAANGLYKEKLFREAVAHYDTAIQLDPGYSKAYNNRAMIRALYLHDLSGAIADFNAAIRIDPDYADAWVGRGSVKFMLKDPEGACNDWKKAQLLGSQQAGRLIELKCNHK